MCVTCNQGQDIRSGCNTLGVAELIELQDAIAAVTPADGCGYSAADMSQVQQML